MKSITEILRSRSEDSAALRKFLCEAFSKPKLNPARPITSSNRSKDSFLVGKAFGYLLRFELLRKYPEYVHAHTSLAESAMKYFDKNNLSVSTKDRKLVKMKADKLLDFNQNNQSRNKDINMLAREKYKWCVDILVRYINSNKVSRKDVFKACLFFGQLHKRALIGMAAGKMHIDLGRPNASTLADLKGLHDHLDISLLAPDQHCILSPTLGQTAERTGGDECLIIDEALIEVRTTNYPKLDRPLLNRLICYYLLHELIGTTGHAFISIRSIGIYYPRQNYLWKIPVASLGRKKAFETAAELLQMCL